MRVLSLLVLAAASGAAQNAVSIRVNAAETVGPFKPIYGYFGYDEPNYTYAKYGRKLVGELAALSRVPVYIRTHFMLATGDGTPGLKWGSTNAYTEDASGKPVYNWTITDRIFDTYLEAGARPFVEIGFMPQALSVKPEPYRPTWIPGARNDQYSIGWSYPPKDYARWGELVYQWVRHAVEKYGRSEVESWYWEVWNEPDISYWHGTPEEYDKLYDYAADGLKRALPSARIGGPATTGPANPRAAAYLRQFLEHCATGKNAATGATGAPLDFITYHAKGAPTVREGHVRMGIAKNASDVANGFEIVTSFPKFRGLPIVLSESDPEGCAACSARVYPQNAYRNGPLYPVYTAAMLKNIFELAGRAGANIEGMQTWAFEFEDQPYFDGFRALATNGIDKPVLNVFRMAGLMSGDRVKVESSGAVPLAAMLKEGVAGDPDVDALATRSDREISVMVWNYHDDDVPAPDADVRLEVASVPGAAGRVLLRHYRIDQTHSNAYTVWKQMGSPQNPAPEQYAALEAAGQLQLLESPRWIPVRAGQAGLTFHLPRQGVSLVQLEFPSAARAAAKPLFRDPVYDGAADPVLVWNRADRKWNMFYTNRRASAPNLPGVSWVHGTRIGIAQSADRGATWQYTGTAEVDYGKPDYTHWAPDIVDYQGVYHMFLSVVPGIFNDWNAPRDIVHLTSPDLRKWKYESTLDLGSDRVIDPSVIQLAGGAWRMWYKNERAKDGSLYYADSPDLYHWTSKGNAIPGIRGEGPKIFRWQDRYWMIADVWDGLAAFSSADCLHWTRQPDNLLKEPGTAPTDRAKGNHADVVVSGGRAYLFYFAHQGGKDAEGQDPGWPKRSVIQVTELENRNGVLACDRDKPVSIDLQPVVNDRP